MANEFEDDKDIDIDLDLDEEEEEDDKGGGKKKEEEGDKKPEAPEAKRARLKRQLKQLDKKHGFKDEDDEEDDKPSKKSSKKKEEEGLDRVDRAVLRAEKITHPDDVALVEELMRDTGKDLETVLETKYFKKELEALREERAAEDAIPKGTKRSSQASRDSIEYWLKKDELPPNDPELRRKVVNAKIDKEKSKSQFSDTPVIK